MGGASGILFGSLFIKAGEKSLGKYELSTGELAEALRAGLDGIMERGKAAVGDKTMVDALAPGVEALETAASDNADLAAALRMAAAAAEEGMKATTDLTARRGRASYLGERSVGHQDPGATSIHLIIKTLHEVVS
jgi:dihydroxyacetone kinase-like protein